MSRQRRGRTAHKGGEAAEDIALRVYQERGARMLARRWRGPEGELDLVIDDAGILVFAEVKQRTHAIHDDPVTPAQWRRLEETATRYMMENANQTGTARGCRFDLVLVDRQGRAEVIENARIIEQ